MNKNEKIIGAKKSNGLTLIQLMTIIGVAGIVIAVAASKWG
jgi:Tfp pilus assembly major pilin PilA